MEIAIGRLTSYRREDEGCYINRMITLLRLRGISLSPSLAGAVVAACVFGLAACVRPVTAERFVVEPYARPDGVALGDTLYLALDPTISPMTLLAPERPHNSPRYEDFRGSVTASIAAMLDERSVVVVLGEAPSPRDFQLVLHRFEPTLRRAGNSASTQGASLPLTTVAIDYDAILTRGGGFVAGTTGAVVSAVPYHRGRGGFQASNADAVERALSRLWSELEDDLSDEYSSLGLSRD